MYSSIIVGTGFSGICIAIRLKERGLHNFVILEKAEDLGGTWRENTYPGAECDIPSALYSYSFEPYPYWEYKWSHQHQILDYLKYCSKKYQVDQHIHFQKELISAIWEEDSGHWRIVAKDGSSYQTKTLITAVGQLHYPSTPEIPGFADFKGLSFHSANWNHEVKLEGKNIAVIGNAASAVQFIPQISKIAKSVTVFQRTANWMLPKQDRLYKEWEKKLVMRFPFLLKMYRFRLWMLGGGLYFLMGTGNGLLRRYYQNLTKKYIKEYITDEQLVNKLIPDFPMGAKRILFSDDYYEALNKDHVGLVTDSIKRIQKDGVKTDNGSLHICDVIVYATGFKTNPFLMGLDIRGKNGLTIREAWQDGPRNYLGMTVSDFPCMFMMYGPNTNLGHNSIIIMSEAQAGYIAQAVSAIEEKGWHSLDIKKKVLDTYFDNIQSRLRQMIWTKIETSWYKSANGNIPNNWPGRTMEYTWKTRKVNFSDYNIIRKNDS